jgi:myo-inositol-1(or 4)-monophosphatase
MSDSIAPALDFDIAAQLEIAELAALRAGAALREQRAAWSRIEAEEGREVKVAADTRAEALILDLLAKLSPFPILSEEEGWVGEAANARAVWAVDPLDGSVNYIQGYPQCAVSIALVVDRKPVLGVVDMFLLGERYSGVVGHGAWLNGQAIRVSRTESPGKAVLNTGIPARVQADGAAFVTFMEGLRPWRKVRMIGSAAAALAYVAAGKADAYREMGAMLWDVAGGCALVEAAGGRVRLEGDALDQPLIVRADNGLVAA